MNFTGMKRYMNLESVKISGQIKLQTSHRKSGIPIRSVRVKYNLNVTVDQLIKNVT